MSPQFAGTGPREEDRAAADAAPPRTGDTQAGWSPETFQSDTRALWQELDVALTVRDPLHELIPSAQVSVSLRLSVRGQFGECCASSSLNSLKLVV
jgi:hypothetical protein